MRSISACSVFLGRLLRDCLEGESGRPAYVLRNQREIRRLEIYLLISIKLLMDYKARGRNFPIFGKLGNRRLHIAFQQQAILDATPHLAVKDCKIKHSFPSGRACFL